MQQKRNKQFVDSSVQGAILWRLVLHWALFLFAAATFVYFVDLLSGVPRDAGKNLLARHGPTLFAFLVLAPAFLWDLNKLTNRFAGPMVRLRRAMHDLAEGREVPPLQFRPNDFWSEIAVDFNRVANRVQAVDGEDRDTPRSSLHHSETENVPA